MVRIR